MRSILARLLRWLRGYKSPPPCPQCRGCGLVMANATRDCWLDWVQYANEHPNVALYPMPCPVCSAQQGVSMAPSIDAKLPGEPLPPSGWQA